jgi:hypothetical protein
MAVDMRRSRPTLQVRLKCSTLFARYDRHLLKIGRCLALPMTRRRQAASITLSTLILVRFCCESVQYIFRFLKKIQKTEFALELDSQTHDDGNKQHAVH